MWPFQSKPSKAILIKEIDSISKALDELFATELLSSQTGMQKHNDDFLRLLGMPNSSDKFTFQTMQSNFFRATERYKHDELKSFEILQDWREFLLIARISLTGDAEKYPLIELKMTEIQKRLQSKLGEDYQHPVMPQSNATGA